MVRVYYTEGGVRKARFSNGGPAPAEVVEVARPGHDGEPLHAYHLPIGATLTVNRRPCTRLEVRSG